MLDKINSYIAQLPLEVEPRGLYEPIRYVLSLGGKRIRPMLMTMAYSLWRNDARQSRLKNKIREKYFMLRRLIIFECTKPIYAYASFLRALMRSIHSCRRTLRLRVVRLRLIIILNPIQTRITKMTTKTATRI